MIMNGNENFSTNDLHISAVLVALGHKLDRIEKSPSGRATFFFQESPSLTESLQEYWNLELRLNPQKIFDSLKFLKTRLYNEQNHVESRGR